MDPDTKEMLKMLVGVKHIVFYSDKFYTSILNCQVQKVDKIYIPPSVQKLFSIISL